MCRLFERKHSSHTWDDDCLFVRIWGWSGRFDLLFKKNQMIKWKIKYVFLQGWWKESIFKIEINLNLATNLKASEARAFVFHFTLCIFNICHFLQHPTTSLTISSLSHSWKPKIQLLLYTSAIWFCEIKYWLHKHNSSKNKPVRVMPHCEHLRLTKSKVECARNVKFTE